MESFYHGTNRPDEVLAKGFDIDAPRRCDPGDFGWGVYLTAQLARATSFGKVLSVRVDLTRFALVPNPYFLENGKSVLPATPEEKLFYECVFHEGGMKTVTARGEERAQNAKEVRRVFLAAGYTGIRTLTYDREAVVFDPSTILAVEIFKKERARRSPSR